MRWLAIIGIASRLLAQTDPQILTEYHRAWELAGQLRIEEAIPALQGVIEKHKDFEPAYRTLAQAFYWGHRKSEGEQYFERLADADLSDPLPLVGLTFLYILTNSERQLDTAVECIRRSHERPDSWYCYGHLVSALQTVHKKVPSEAELNRVVREHLANPARHLARVAWLIANRKLGEAYQLATAAIDEAKGRGHREIEAVLYEMRASSRTVTNDHTDLSIDADMERAEQLQAEIGDHEREVNAACARAAREIRRRDPRGRQRMLRALEKVQAWGHVPMQPPILYALALDMEAVGDDREAIRLYSRATAISDRIDPRTSFGYFERMGHAHRRVGEVKEAIAAYEAARQRAGAYEPFIAFAHRYLGDLYEELGEFSRALAAHRESYRLFRRQNTPSLLNTAGASLTRIGKVYAAVGDFAIADEHFRQARQIAQQGGDLDPMQRVLTEMGHLDLKRGRAESALRLFDEVLQLGERTRNITFEIPAVLGKGRALVYLRRWHEALVTLEKAQKLADDNGVRALSAEARVELGKLSLRQNKLEAARESFTHALWIAEPIGLLRTAVSARRGLAEICTRKGDEGGALDELRAAVRMLEALRNQIPGPNLRATYAAETWRVYQVAIRLLVRKGTMRSHAEAFELLERGRSRAFLDMLSETAARANRGLTPEQKAQQRALTAAVSRASAAMLRSPSAGHDRELAEAEAKLRTWMTEIRILNPEFRQLQYAQALDLDGTKKMLPDRETALIAFVLDEPRSSAFVVGQRSCHHVMLAGRAAIESGVRALRAELTFPPRGAASSTFETASAKLSSELFRPLRPYLNGYSRLIIVPDGLLHYLPFESLVTQVGPARFLLEDYTVAYAPSASVYRDLVEAARRRKRIERRELLAFGDPALGGGPASETRSALERSGLVFGPLPNARVEVERIGQLYAAVQRRVYIGSNASEARVKAEGLDRFQTVHFATHAAVDERVPVRSGILLSESQGAEDGLLTLEEIYNLELNADLVVLSACQSGLGKLVRGEGMIGLTRAIFYAGSSRVAVSLWNVNDLTTAGLMEEFYRAMRAGQSPATALRSAKLSMIRSSAPGLRHPYYWAPFVLAGLF